MTDNRETITDQQLLEALREMDSPIISTSEIAEMEEVPISQGQVLKRLKSLEERDRVGSKSYVAKPQIRLWWHSGVELKEAWTSKNGVTEEIGVEVVDVLELPGRGEKLKKRREAVNAVFKFLFSVETASKYELKFVGWGADMETYADPDSLWNNCLKKALDQSPFYFLYATQKEWRLSNVGSYAKKNSNQALWEDWDEIKQWIEEVYHGNILGSFFEDEYNFSFYDELNLSEISISYGESKTTIIYNIQMDGACWSTSTGSLRLMLQISEEVGETETIVNSIEHLGLNDQDNFQLLTPEKDPIYFLSYSYEFDIGVANNFNQLDKADGRFINSISKLRQWERKTVNKLINADNELKRLVS